MNKIRLKQIFTTILISTLLSASFSAFAKDTTDYYSLAKDGNIEEIQAAFKSKSSIKNAVYGSNRETFLMLILQYDRPLDIIKTVINLECSVTAKAKDKKTPLMYAAQYLSQEDALRFVVETGAKSQSAKTSKITSKDKEGKDCLYYATLNKSLNAYSILASYISEKELQASEKNNAKFLKNEKKTNETSPGMVTFTFTGSFNEEQPETSIAKAEEPKNEVEVSKTTNTQEVAPLEVENNDKEASIEKNNISSEEEKTESKSEEILKTETDEMPRITLDTVAPVQEKNISQESAPKPEQKIEEAPASNKTDIKTYSQVSLFDYALSQNAVPERQEKKTLSFIKDPNEADEYGVTLLMKACKAGNDWDVQNLIENGADINLRDKDGWSALMYAVRYQNNLSLVKKLIDNGAHIRVRNIYNATPLLLAADYSQNPEIIKVLLNNRSVAENEVYNAFILCLTSGFGSDHIKMAKVQIFLDMDIPLNRLWKGKTPLMYACQYSNTTAIINQLLEKGAKTNITDKSGLSAFDYAKENTKLVHDDIYWSLNAK